MHVNTREEKVFVWRQPRTRTPEIYNCNSTTPHEGNVAFIGDKRGFMIWEEEEKNVNICLLLKSWDESRSLSTWSSHHKTCDNGEANKLLFHSEPSDDHRHIIDTTHKRVVKFIGWSTPPFDPLEPHEWRQHNTIEGAQLVKWFFNDFLSSLFPIQTTVEISLCVPKSRTEIFFRFNFCGASISLFFSSLLLFLCSFLLFLLLAGTAVSLTIQHRMCTQNTRQRRDDDDKETRAKL